MVTGAAPVLELRRACRVFDGPSTVYALDHVDLTVNTGDYMAIIGPSGSGKTTLLNIIGLLDRLTSGHYLLDGIDTTTLTENQRALLRGQRMGFVFQAFHLINHRTIEENVAVAQLYNHTPRTGRLERAVQALERVGLTHRIGFTPATLSGGERQRVAIARALINNPTVLLCDEPTGNLDTTNTNALLDLLDTLHMSGTTLVVITHDPVVAHRATTSRHLTDGALTP